MDLLNGSVGRYSIPKIALSCMLDKLRVRFEVRIDVLINQGGFAALGNEKDLVVLLLNTGVRKNQIACTAFPTKFQ